jgi:predicted extracellular nuclease
MSGWAEGFFLAAVKRAGQALEARLLVDTLFDVDPEALILVCGDFNADLHQVPVRTIRGDEEDAGNAHLAFRTLVPVERSLARSRRFSVVHHGRPQMLDHVLVSRALLAWYRGVEVHNEALGDELMTPQAVAGAPESFHAPVVAEFRLPGA